MTVATVPRCLTIAASDSGGGAGVQADLKAFAAAGCFGMSAVVGLTAQNTRGIAAVHEVPPGFVVAQLDAVFEDIGVDAAKTGALLSAAVVEAVASYLETHGVSLVVDPLLRASADGTQLLGTDATRTMIKRLFPLATVVTPNIDEARVLTGVDAPQREQAERIVALGAPAVLITGGHADPIVDHLYDGRDHVDVAVERVRGGATHGSGCTHSATLTAELAKGASLVDAARTAAQVTAAAIAAGHIDLGAGEGPVDVLQSTGASQRLRTKE